MDPTLGIGLYIALQIVKVAWLASAIKSCSGKSSKELETDAHIIRVNDTFPWIKLISLLKLLLPRPYSCPLLLRLILSPFSLFSFHLAYKCCPTHLTHHITTTTCCLYCHNSCHSISTSVSEYSFLRSSPCNSASIHVHTGSPYVLIHYIHISLLSFHFPFCA